MTKQCLHCSRTFKIYPKDLDFYQRIGVPAPTWCPRCREMRRMAWCNEGVLYKRNCAKCHRDIISEFPANNPRIVWCATCWWKDDWDPTIYAKQFDYSKPFFEQFHELDLVVPHACVQIDDTSENSEYTHQAGQNKDCYMIFHATFNENCLYGYGVKKDKDCLDVHNCFESELCYECVDVNNCYNVGWSQDCFNCTDSRFLYDCHGVSDSMLCVGLRNKKYCFLNEQLSEADYKKTISQLNTGSFAEIQTQLKKYSELKLKHPRKFAETNKTNDITGDHLFNVAYAQACFDCRDAEHIAYSSQLQLSSKDCYDLYQFGINTELAYEGAMIGANTYNILFSNICIFGVSNLTYCMECFNATNECFGSCGLKKGKYCILNKQYDEAEYYQEKAKIIQHMKQTGEWGEFFPIKFSQSAYNETMANLWFPLSKEQVSANGWLWQDDLPGTFGKGTLPELPDDIKNAQETITKEVLTCLECRRNYKIIAREFEFYRKQHYPIPRQCFDCRRKARMTLRNPRNIWSRQCMCTQTDHTHSGRCAAEFETTYSPERKELVYCEGCYQKEIL